MFSLKGLFRTVGISLISTLVVSFLIGLLQINYEFLVVSIIFLVTYVVTGITLLAVGYSRNEAAIQAIDQVVEAELPGLDEMLETYITDKIHTKLTDIRQVAADVIQRNNGVSSKSEMTVFKDGRVQVKAVVHFEGQEQEKFLRKIVSDIPQKGSGPKLDFVHRLGWGEATYPLD